MKITRKQLEALSATSCAREECIVAVDGNHKPYIGHLAFDLEDDSGNVIGEMALRDGAWFEVPLSKMVFTPKEPKP